MTKSPTLYQTIHGYAGDLFEAIPDPEACKLAARQIDDFRTRGFCHGPRVLDDNQIAVLRERLERIRSGEHPHAGELYEVDEAYRQAPDKNVFHFLGAWRIDDAFHDLVFYPKITVPVSQLLASPRVRFWHDQVFYKPPRHPGVVSWHQDYSYWTRTTPPRHLTCWIALDDTSLNNGCIHFVPGSHQWALLPKESLLEDMDAIKEHLTPEQQAGFKPEPLELEAGECSFHDCLTLHGSYGNNSDGPRRGVVVNFMHPETRCTDGTAPLLRHTSVIPEGAIVEGTDYPIVYG